MMNAWRYEISWILGGLALVLVLGGLLGEVSLIFTLYLLVSLGILVVKIHRLERWLREGMLHGNPKSKGIWEEIYYHLYRIKKKEKRRKKHLAKMLQQFRKSTAALPDAAVVLGQQDEIEWVNKSARRVLGLKKSDRSQRIPNLIRYPEFIKYLRQKNYEGTIIIRSPVDQAILLEIRVIEYGAGLRLLLAQDVTQFKKMERMRKDFVANISHELRTPLTVLKGYLETLTDNQEPQPPMLKNSLDKMYRQTTRMTYLVNDLLMLARLETKPHETVCINVPALLEEICSEGQVSNEENRVRLSLEAGLKMFGDEQELRSAFSNLVVNALKYSPDESVVDVRWQKQAAGLIFVVEDQGVGISSIDLPRITERFYRVDVQKSRTNNGTGLGLAIVKHVMVRHNAELKITSELGKGSCFSCIFPSDAECNQVIDSAGEEAVKSSVTNETFLSVE
ncbi:MAG: phosphate regulon sensor histidine kinase PhoR [Methylococcaceae bacterium]